MSVTLFRNANIDLYEHGNGSIDLILDDKQEVHLSKRHSIARSVASTNLDTVRESLMNGHFCVEDYINRLNGNSEVRLKDWRPSHYSGFIHDDAMIERMNAIENLKTFKKENITIGKYGDGGNFDVTTGFDFDVFKKSLDTSIGIIRFICSNGLVVKDKILDRSVPIINMHEYHIGIAAEMTMQAAKNRMTEQLLTLDTKVASVRDVLAVKTHIESRIADGVGVLPEHLNRLNGMNNLILDGNLDQYYTENALKSAAISETLPSHLDSYTLYNLITEMRTHTPESARSTELALDTLASRLLLGENKVCSVSHRKPTRTFVSPEQAFVV